MNLYWLLSKNKNFNTALLFYSSVWIYTSFITVKWRHSKHESHLTPLRCKMRFSSTCENSRKDDLICKNKFYLNLSINSFVIRLYKTWLYTYILQVRSGKMKGKKYISIMVAIHRASVSGSLGVIYSYLLLMTSKI